MSQRGHVGSEYIGLARLFRQAVLRADRSFMAAVQGIIRPLEARFASRKPLPSKRLLTDMAEAWRALSAPYRLSLDVNLGTTKRRLEIGEHRISATSSNNLSWSSPALEEGVAITRVVLRIADGGYQLVTRPLSVISLHALARRYERLGTRTAGDDAPLVADIAALLIGGDADRVPCPSGIWLSNSIIAHDDQGRLWRCRDVRTYLPAEALETISA